MKLRFWRRTPVQPSTPPTGYRETKDGVFVSQTHDHVTDADREWAMFEALRTGKPIVMGANGKEARRG